MTEPQAGTNAPSGDRGTTPPNVAPPKEQQYYWVSVLRTYHYFERTFNTSLMLPPATSKIYMMTQMDIPTIMSTTLYRDGLSQEMEEVIEVGHEQFLANLSQRAANDQTADGGDILKSVRNIVVDNDLAGKSRQALIEYLMAGPNEKDMYEPLVNLCNGVLRGAREHDLATKLAEHLQPEDRQIEFIRYDSLPLKYDWASKRTNKEESDSGHVRIKPDILIVLEDGIGAYKAGQKSAKKETVFHPGAPASAEPPKARIGLKDVLGCVEVKRGTVSQRRAASQKAAQMSASLTSLNAPGGSESHNTSQSSAPTSTVKRKARESGVDTPPEKSLKVSAGQSASSTPVSQHSLQTGHYASLFLSRGPYATHTFGIEINCNDVQISWFDRQSTISTTKFSVSNEDDFVFFITLIIIFSRLSLKDWGIIPALYPNNRNRKIRYRFDNDRVLKIDMTVKPVYHRVSFHGRGTMVLRGELLTGTSKEDVVVKISHPEKRRVPEPVFVRAGLDSTYKEHFAELHHDVDLGPPTGDIRTFFGRDRGCERQCRMIIFEPLGPITSLRDPKHIARVWLDCLKTHHAMWVLKYEHNDISLNNLMYRETGKGDDNEVVDKNKRETRQKGKGASVGGIKGKSQNESGSGGESESEDGSEDDSEDGSEWDKGGSGQENKKEEEERNKELTRVLHGVMGILHDWDLAKSHHDPEPVGAQKAERTGTVPFIALDIAKNLKLPPRRRYRHDLESFGWCLLYICLDCKTNQEELYDWGQRRSRALRLAFLLNMHESVPRKGFEDLYHSAQVFMKWLMIDILRVNLIGQTPEEKSDGEIWDGVCSILRDEFDEEI